MSVRWTEEQKKVIDVRNKNVLVSAAAGSGKTAVLVERILSLVCGEGEDEKPLDVDRLLVVTLQKPLLRRCGSVWGWPWRNGWRRIRKMSICRSSRH